MAKSHWMPKDDAGKIAWLNNFAAKLTPLQIPLGLTAAEVTAAGADAAFFTYVFNAQQQIAAYAQQWTAYKNAARNGTGASLGAAPAAPLLGALPLPVAPGILGRAAMLAARIKTLPGYTESIGQALQIIGAERLVDLTTIKPEITATLTAGQVIVGWTKQGLDGVEILVDRGEGKGFIFLAVDTVPDYTDTAALPIGHSALWKYQAIYRQGDERVGQWSDVVSLPVAG